MQKPSAALQRLKQNFWHPKIREAKEKGLTSLDLSGEGLSTLPEELLELVELTTLNLSGNQFSTLPESITRLRKLTTLNLSNNGLSALPEPVTRLPRLTTLNLSNNALETLPESITRLQNLVALDLSENADIAIPESIARLEKLTTLDLSHIRIKTIPEPVTNLRNLTTLHLRWNKFLVWHNGIPESIVQLQNLTTLSLSRVYISDSFPEAITQLPNLITLELSHCSIRAIPGSISRLQRLTTLDLSNNSLTMLPEEIGQLQSLTSLNLDQNELHTLPESIGQLQNLTTLNLDHNKLSMLPETIGQLQSLTTLSLDSNQLRMIPESSGQLRNLITLNLGYNALFELPESIAGWQNLTTLNLWHNYLDTLPASIGRLHNLSTLIVSSNQLDTLPMSLGQLQNLIMLNLAHNQLSTLPESVAQLQNLTELDLSANQLGTIPEPVTRLQNLTDLFLQGNPLNTIPESITRLQNLTNWYFDDQLLVTPPIEVVDEGFDAIRQYYRQLNEEGKDTLYEAKLLILGEGGAGKTTFANKILDPDYVLKDEEPTTKGVEVLTWSFPIQGAEGSRQFRVNLWDFGGQEIYHATHQFFLTRRSLYILVTDTRKEDTDFYYWLNIAELLGENSPILIVKNEKQDRHREINERSLKGQFAGLKEILATNLATNRGLEEVKQEIEHYIQKLPHIGTSLPRTWVRVRERLEEDPRNHISIDEYQLICKENGFAETSDALQLSGYLNDIGVFLHFQDEPLLRKTVILKPKWGTDAVYKLLDNKTVIRHQGRFTRADLEAIWSTPEYESMRDELLQLMMKFKLCYEIPTQKGTYIAPQLLTENQPDYKWNEQENLLLRYTYEFMPKGILTQFIVVMHPYILEQRVVWKSGVVIEKDATRAEVIEYYGKREIHVRVTGAQARDVMTVIRHELKQIHDAYRRLKYDELVPCNCSTCKDNPEPHFYPVAKLMEFRGNNQLEIQCQNKPYNMVNVMRLLGDFIDLGKASERGMSPDIHVYGNYYAGDHMTEINQHIEGSTIHGSVVAAESIKDSFNVIEKSNAQDELKEYLTQLTQAVDAMIKELPKEKAEEAAEDMKILAEQAVKEKPNPKWYNVSIEGLIAAAQNIGKVGDAVIELTGKVRKLLMGGL